MTNISTCLVKLKTQPYTAKTVKASKESGEHLSLVNDLPSGTLWHYSEFPDTT